MLNTDYRLVRARINAHFKSRDDFIKHVACGDLIHGGRLTDNYESDSPCKKKKNQNLECPLTTVQLAFRAEHPA